MSIPPGKHTDWPWPLSLILRSANAIEDPNPPAEVYTSENFDRAHKHPDVPNEGAWALSLHPKYGFSFATVQNGELFAVGTFRYDYVDRYYTFPRLELHRMKA